MKQFLLPLLGLALTLTAASCDSKHKTEDPQPATPAPAATMDRTFFYPASTVSSGIGYAPDELQTSAYYEPTTLSINVGPKSQQDALHFGIQRSRLASALTGTYSLQGLGSLTNDAVVRYSYAYVLTDSQTSLRLFDSNTTQMEGHVRITEYDADRHLLSGSYEVRLPDVSDPTLPSRAGQNAPRCRVTVSGTFENVRLE
ncbi:hypothetical protein [Hymenobacter sp. CRA2]|uniref:hypothetical protein n=1 Tax=Hymenobacter sp. CRA2 TaxID=1955620 RepID=UPI00098FACF9|nr:hypothetical protein [Hymenobacter sp. CRA2]OON66741.1 hypothetical protein B0919_21415 [Hymenobacter sp. CRA2]